MKQYKILHNKIRIESDIAYYNAEKASIGNVCMHCAMSIASISVRIAASLSRCNVDVST